MSSKSNEGKWSLNGIVGDGALDIPYNQINKKNDKIVLVKIHQTFILPLTLFVICVTIKKNILTKGEQNGKFQKNFF